MHNSQSITAVLPVQNATKVSNTSTDSKANNNFNQVYKNEVANKTKKSPAEPVKNNAVNNTKPAANNNSVTTKAKPTEATNKTSNELDKVSDEETEKDVVAQSNLSDPATLISFVGDIITLGHGSRTESEEETNAAALDLSTVDTSKTSLVDTAPVLNTDTDNSLISPSNDKSTQFTEIQVSANAELSATKTSVLPDLSLNKSNTSAETTIQSAPKETLSTLATTSQLQTPEIAADQVKELVELPTPRIEKSASEPVKPKVDTTNITSTNVAITEQSANNNIKESGIPISNDRNINNIKIDQSDSAKINRESELLGVKTTAVNVPINEAKTRSLPTYASKNVEQVFAGTVPSEDTPIVEIGKQVVQQSIDSVSTEIQARDPNKLVKVQVNNAMTAFAMNRQDKSVNNEMQVVGPQLQSTSNLESIPAATPTSAPPVEISPKQVKQVVDNTDFSQTGLSRSERFAEALSSKFAEVHQEQNLQQKSTAIGEFVINTQQPEVVTQPTAAQVATTAVNNIPATEHIAARFGTKAWDQAIGQKIVWMVAGGEQSAQLTLNPPDLGPVQVVLSISDNFVDASFVSSHLDVREAIEAAAPQLREMMDNAGISLSGFSVSAESAQTGNPFNANQSGSGPNSQSRGASKVDSQPDTLTNSAPAPRPKQELGLVDTFA